MNKLDHAFDPALAQLYSRQLSVRNQLKADCTEANRSAESRHLFYQLNQHGNNQDIMPQAYAFISQRLNATKQDYAPFFLQGDAEGQLANLHATKILPIPEQLGSQENLSACVDQAAPILLTQPCWLQHISPTSFSQSTTAVQLMSLYLQLTRTSQGHADLLAAYHSLLLITGNKLPNLHSYGYSHHSEVFVQMLDFAAVQLSLARFPRVLLPEILGFTLAYCQMPSLIEVCFPNHPLPPLFFKLRQQRAKQQLASLSHYITQFLQFFSGQQALGQRVQNGFWLYHLQMQRCRDQLNTALESPLSPQQAIVKLFKHKASAAIGHHQKIQLQGKSMDHWFAGMPENMQEFLYALKQSAYVDQEKPLDSALLNFFTFNGPMFGVLNESELDLLRNWLQHGLNGTPSIPTKLSKKAANTLSQPLNHHPTMNFAKCSTRELYYYLLNADLFPDVLSLAKRIVGKRLQACTYFNRLPFPHYTHEQFEIYIENIYQREINAYQPLQGKPKISREAYIWGLEQIAPMILIDGCWLQNSLNLEHVNPEIGEILFRIYCDEIGNGQLEQNHPYIFQQLLDSLSIQLPPVYSSAFVSHPGFINSAFDLPVYMLSLSCFSVEFLPELLGLNMAIELSGLGKSYMRLVDDWNYWGIDTRIANIHISIDNYASGHTFLAKKAIQLYMDGILQNTDDRAILDRHWRRIYTGYASLRFVGARFRWSLPFWYLLYKFRHKQSVDTA